MAIGIDGVCVAALLARGRTAVVDALRSAAGALHGLADALDTEPSPTAEGGEADAGSGTDACVERPEPGLGTRERIGEALQRAKSRYDAVVDRPPTRSRPR